MPTIVTHAIFLGLRLALVGGISLKEGIPRMAAWACAAGARPTSRFGAIEIDRNLPPVWRG